jgi:O-antigen/teichoic acid export membrane protein
MSTIQVTPQAAQSSRSASGEAVALRKQTVLQQSSSVFCAQMVALAAGILGTLLVARMGGAEGKGVLYRLQFVSSIALVLLNCGLGPAAVYLFRREAEHPENRIAAEEIAAILLWPSLLLGCLPMAALELSRVIPGLVHLGDWRTSAQLAFLAVPAYTVVWNLSYLYLATGRIVAYNLLRSSQSCLFALMLAALWLARIGSLRWVTLCWIAAVVGPALFALLVLSATVGLWRLPGRQLLRRAFGFAWRSHLGAVVQYLQHRTDVVLILWLLPIRDLGVYSLAIGLVELLWYVPQAVSQVLLPHIADATEAEANRMTSAFCRASVAVTALLSLTLAALAGWAIPHLLPAFTQAVPVIWILLPGTVVASIFKVLASDLNGRGQPLKTVFPATAALLFSALGCWWALPRYGLMGAATVTSLSYFLNAGLYLVRCARMPEMDLRSMLVLKASDLTGLRVPSRALSRVLLAERRG